MYFSLTGISYLIILIALVFLAYRFYHYWRDKQDFTSKLFFFFACSLCLFMGVRTFVVLFFLNNEKVLLGSLYPVAFFQIISAVIGVFIVSNIKFPKISPWILPSIIFFIGLITLTLLHFANYSSAYVSDLGSVIWKRGVESPFDYIYSLLRTLILAIGFIPLMVVMFQKVKETEDKTLKKRSFGLGIILLIGSTIGLWDFIFISMFDLGPIFRDISMAILGILLFFVVLVTQKPSVKYTTSI